MVVSVIESVDNFVCYTKCVIIASVTEYIDQCTTAC